MTSFRRSSSLVRAALRGLPPLGSERRYRDASGRSFQLAFAASTCRSQQPCTVIKHQTERLKTPTQSPAASRTSLSDIRSAAAQKVPGDGSGEAVPGSDSASHRILPDLTAKPALPTAQEQPHKRNPRFSTSSKPRNRKSAAKKTAPASRARPKSEAPAIAERTSAPKPPLCLRVRRRPKDATGLGPGERWKRRRPRFAR